MIITAPVTDYIPASILTTAGDILRRGSTGPERLARPVNKSFLSADDEHYYPSWRTMHNAAGLYFKSLGIGDWPGFSALALRDTGVHIDQSGRDTGGNQVISGVGFEASVIIFFAIDTTSANQNFSVGFDNRVNSMCISRVKNGTEFTYNDIYCIQILRDPDNKIIGILSARDSNSFTITWTLTGACTTTFIYLCLP
ncbi:hypothetical protein ES703_32301 [subsurface metagenome]